MASQPALKRRLELAERKALEGDEILVAGREVGQHFGIPASKFRRVLAIKHFPSDFLGFRGDTVFLSRFMVGKLEAEEWKPLLASYLSHKKTRRQGLLPTALLIAAEYLILLFAGLVLIAWVLGQSGALLALGYSLVTFAVFVTNRSTQDTKKRRLKADIEATKIIEREKFLQTLRKIDSFNLRDVEGAKKSRLMSHFSTRPSITVRINNLLTATNLSAVSRG
jgi:Zn-dependent protease with chaperone function